MNLYVIRRPNGWHTPEELASAAAVSRKVGERGDARRHSLDPLVVVHEAGGGLGTFCIYQASSAEKIREHAARAGIPASDILEVADTVIVRPDPVAIAT